MTPATGSSDHTPGGRGGLRLRHGHGRVCRTTASTANEGGHLSSRDLHHHGQQRQRALPTVNDPADVAINEDASLQTVNLTGIGTGAPNEAGPTGDGFLGQHDDHPQPDRVLMPAPIALGTLSFTPVANANDVINGGPTTVTVTVSDGTDSVQQTFLVSVASVNDRPAWMTRRICRLNEDAAAADREPDRDRDLGRA
ncbi:MAG: cadherin-like domain-containing protein [Desulfomicrobium escambiense]|nr:cadherin-like domain-containing protein [Desulfomicrobium escambiense]